MHLLREIPIFVKDTIDETIPYIQMQSTIIQFGRNMVRHRSNTREIRGDMIIAEINKI